MIIMPYFQRSLSLSEDSFVGAALVHAGATLSNAGLLRCGLEVYSLVAPRAKSRNTAAARDTGPAWEGCQCETPRIP